MMPDGPLILYGFFRGLLDAGMKLGVADYLDAVRALRLELSGAVPGAEITRDRLRRICHIVWARRPEERRIIDAVFRAFPAASAEQVREFEEAFAGLTGSAGAVVEPGLQTDMPGGATDWAPQKDRTRARVDFEASHGETGIPLPRLILPLAGAAQYILQPQTVIPERALAVLWRRFRKLTRAGPKTELDIEGTIADRCRRGVMAGPIMRSPRKNCARLLILLDASPSMAPWQPFLAAVERSLTLSRLDRPGLFYFHNLPKRAVYRSPALSGGMPLADLTSQYRGASLLIVSDGGAARGFLNHRRARDTQNYLAEAKRSARAVVWVNPMPRQRWTKTTAERLARSGAATFLPLDLTHLIRAVDILRGARSS